MSSLAVLKHPKGQKRRQEILEMALYLADAQGFNSFTSVKLSQKLGCSWGVIFHYFHNMDTLRDAVMALAIERRNAKVLLQGLTCKNTVALSAPDELKELAKALLD